MKEIFHSSETQSESRDTFNNSVSGIANISTQLTKILVSILHTHGADLGSSFNRCLSVMIGDSFLKLKSGFVLLRDDKIWYVLKKLFI